MLKWLCAVTDGIRQFIQTISVMRVGYIVDITVWDSFSGTVIIVKSDWDKWLVEIIDVNMCYQQQVQLNPGEQMWIHRNDIYQVSRV